MAYFAVIKDNVVENIIVGDDKETLEQLLGVSLIEYQEGDYVGIGFSYDSKTQKFVPPSIPEIASE